MPGAKLAQGSEKGGVCITEALIIKRNLTFPEDEDLSEKMFHTLAELQTVRLDREGITAIRNLEGLQNLHSLYLQVNKIQRIENLTCVPSLCFLSLAGNRIRQVENLRDLPHLQLLDLSENLIETLKLDEFPQSLLILNLTGNPCTKKDGYSLQTREVFDGVAIHDAVSSPGTAPAGPSFPSTPVTPHAPTLNALGRATGPPSWLVSHHSLRELVTEALPLLLDLDGQPVLERWTSDEEDKASGDEDDEFPELSGPFCSEQGFLQELEEEMSKHREHRQQAALEEHLLRMGMEPALTHLPLLPGEPMAGDSGLPVTPEQGKKTPPEPTSSPQPSSATKKPCSVVSMGQQSTGQAGKGARAAIGPRASLAAVPSTTKTTTKRIKK